MRLPTHYPSTLTLCLQASFVASRNSPTFAVNRKDYANFTQYFIHDNASEKRFPSVHSFIQASNPIRQRKKGRQTGLQVDWRYK